MSNSPKVNLASLLNKPAKVSDQKESNYKSLENETLQSNATLNQTSTEEANQTAEIKTQTLEELSQNTINEPIENTNNTVQAQPQVIEKKEEVIKEPEVIKDVNYVVSMTTLNKEDVEKLSPEQFNEVLGIIEKTIEAKKIKEIENEKIVKKTWEEIQKDEVEQEKEDEEFDELFANYKSDFKKEEKSIFKGLRTKRLKIQAKIRMPKTRLSLIIWLVSITIIAISSLFVLFPEQHSFSIYKTSILSAKVKYIDKPWIQKELEMSWYVFKIQIQEWYTKTIYKHKWIVYNTKEELDKFLENEIKIWNELITKQEAERLKKLKKEIIKEVLDNKYKN